MAWPEKMVTILSVLIEGGSSYSHRRLETILATAALYVQQEINLNNTYVINVNTPSITPNPFDIADDIFINFVVLKAACIADAATQREMSLRSGIRSGQGTTNLETLDYIGGFNSILGMGPCQTYEGFKKDYQNGNIENIRAVLSPFAIANSGIVVAAAAVEASPFGETESIPAGYERVLEFDAGELDGFDARWEADPATPGVYSLPKRRFELYSYSNKSAQSFPYGNTIHMDFFQPFYDDDKKAFKFPINPGGNPNLTNALDDQPDNLTGPLYGGGNDGLDASGSKSIRLKTLFRTAFDIEFSEDWWEGFVNVVPNATTAFATFWQFKNHTHGYIAEQILSGVWNSASLSTPEYLIRSRGDSSLTLRDISLWDTNISTTIPIIIGERNRFIIDAKFDDTGDNSYTKVVFNGDTIIEHSGPNCFPITDQPTLDLWAGVGITDTIPAIRGMYFGHYSQSSGPGWDFPNTDPTIWYSNMSYDVEI